MASANPSIKKEKVSIKATSEEALKRALRQRERQELIEEKENQNPDNGPETEIDKYGLATERPCGQRERSVDPRIKPPPIQIDPINPARAKPIQPTANQSALSTSMSDGLKALTR